MGVLDDFARDKTGPQLTMLVAIALLFVSQFFLYLNDPGSGMLLNTSRWDLYTTMVYILPSHWHGLAAASARLRHHTGARDSVSEKVHSCRCAISTLGLVGRAGPGNRGDGSRCPSVALVGGSMGGIAVLIALVAARSRPGDRAQRLVPAKAPQ